MDSSGGFNRHRGAPCLEQFLVRFVTVKVLLYDLVPPAIVFSRFLVPFRNFLIPAYDTFRELPAFRI